jgi:hypothetical protein
MRSLAVLSATPHTPDEPDGAAMNMTVNGQPYDTAGHD